MSNVNQFNSIKQHLWPYVGICGVNDGDGACTQPEEGGNRLIG